MAKIAKNDKKNWQKYQKSIKKCQKNGEKILKNYRTLYSGLSPPPRKYTFFDPKKKYKSIFMVLITKKKYIFLITIKDIKK